MINKNSKIYVAGHKGLVGNAILIKLKNSGYKKLIYASRSELDLTNQKKVLQFLRKKNLILFSLLQPKLEEYIQTINIKQNLYMKIYLFKRI